MSVFKILLRLPWHILLLTGVLVAVGSLALYSASQGSWQPWAGRHAVRAVVGMSLVIGIAFVDFIYIKRLSYVFLMLGIIGLVAVMIIGTGQGVSRWITIGGVSIQPSEPTKIAVILALAHYFSSQPHDRMQSFVWYLPAFVIIAVPFALVLIQPDLGTALMLLFGGLAVIFAAGLPWRYVLGAIVFVVAAIPVLWMQLHTYQKARVLTFLNPEADVLGSGYQITQSKIALGSRGLFGKGFLMGSQSQLNYLPEKQTDFVFTMIGRGVWLCRQCFHIIYLSLAHYLHYVGWLPGSKSFCPAYLYRHRHDCVLLYVCQCGDGNRAATRSWRTAAVYFTRRYINADPVYRFWDCGQRYHP